MNEPFGPSFYVWWSGLPRQTRVAVAAVLLVCAGVAGFVSPDSWILWGPFAAAGVVMLLASCHERAHSGSICLVPTRDGVSWRSLFRRGACESIIPSIGEWSSLFFEMP